MSTEVGTYTVEDAFNITGRGWVVVGTLTGPVQRDNHLVFPSGLTVRIMGIEMPRPSKPERKVGLLLDAPFNSRQELLDQQLIGATARVLE